MNGESMDTCCSFEDLTQRAGEAKHEERVSESQKFLSHGSCSSTNTESLDAPSLSKLGSMVNTFTTILT